MCIGKTVNFAAEPYKNQIMSEMAAKRRVMTLTRDAVLQRIDKVLLTEGECDIASNSQILLIKRVPMIVLHMNKLMICDKVSAEDVSRRMNFNNISTANRFFKRIEGITLKDYEKLIVHTSV